MKRIVLILLSLVLAAAARAQDAEECPNPEGWVPTKAEMQAILSAHEEWHGSEGWNDPTVPGRANLCNADLEGANLKEANLYQADLRGVQLAKANLQGANMTRAALQGATLGNANLQNAILFSANLLGANLSGANLQQTTLGGANLQEANLNSANMKHAVASRAKLQQASLILADLQAADLYAANLQGVKLMSANLRAANLDVASLQGADMLGADLREATLWLTILTDAKLSGANLSGVLYHPTTAPAQGYLSRIIGLSSVKFCPGENSGLVQLREALKAAGLRDLERQATYALERGRTRHALASWSTDADEKSGCDPTPVNRWAVVEGLLRLVFFEWTTDYGLSYGRPILILFGLILFFTPVYWIALVKPRKDGVWRIWSDDRRRQDLGTDDGSKPIEQHGAKAWRTALYFSLLSAFHIGWRDLNVGNWIARIQRYEFTYRATGWARTVSGIQSLLSVYLLAMWALTYFGRPFE